MAPREPERPSPSVCLRVLLAGLLGCRLHELRLPDSRAVVLPWRRARLPRFPVDSPWLSGVAAWKPVLSADRVLPKGGEGLEAASLPHVRENAKPLVGMCLYARATTLKWRQIKKKSLISAIGRRVQIQRLPQANT